ncbi:hypothetical protein ASZ90_002104 [hydrocarbon metagenome]|uniref:TIR domain-containing protein n=1 Tax=hydrocarbon metagenome TaxID=938273 RepID=A0A0W8G4M7_9ZZZZ
MRYDIFISYSRRDNDKGQVASLVEHIAKKFEAFSGRTLDPFFDTKEITGGEYWQDKILTGLKDSRLLLACLSPEYLESKWCEWEFNEYQKYELGRAFLGKGVAPIYFVKVPGFHTAGFEEACAEWITRLRHRQQYDLVPWHEEGEAALQRTEVASRLDELTHQVWEQVRLGELAQNRKGNLDRANERFVGRVQEMERLHRLVGLGKGVGVLTAVNGLGGIGKTALALQYAHAYGDFFAGGCWQILCEGQADLMEAFGSLVGQRDMDFELTDEEKKNPELKFERVLRELKKKAEAIRQEEAAMPPERRFKGNRARVLVLLDNVDKPELLSDEQTRRLPQADWLCLLATTRLGPEDLKEIDDQNFLPVDELLEEDALALIESYQPKRRFKDETQRKAARKIVNLLGRMPLAVEVAAVYMGESRVTCEAFLTRLLKDGQDYFSQVEKGEKGKVRHGEKRLGLTLGPTLERLGDAERLAVDYAALLPADHIPLPWIRALLATKYPEYGRDADIGDPDPWLDLVHHLLGLRLVRESGVVDGNGNPLVVHMHRLVQEVVRDRMGERKEALEAPLAKYAESRAEFLLENWVRREHRWEIAPLVALAEALMADEKQSGADFASMLATPLMYLAQYTEAKRLLERAVEIREKAFAPDHPALATSYSNLALVEKDTGNLAEARCLLLRAIEIEEKAFDQDHPALATSYSNLALVELDLGNLAEARHLLQRAVEIEEKAFEQDHPNLAKDYSNLALVEHALGNLAEARLLLHRTFKIDAKACKLNHLELGKRFSNLAIVEKELGNLAWAKRLLHRTIEIDEKAFEPDHPALARDYSNLAMVEKDMGNLAEARCLLLRAIEIEEKAFDQDHPALGTLYSNVALVEKDLGNLAEARRLLQRAVEIEEKAFEPDHPSLARDYSNLAMVDLDMGNLAEARHHMHRAIEVGEKANEPNLPALATFYSGLGGVEMNQGNMAEARRLFLRGIEIEEMVFDPDHPTLSRDYSNLAMVEQDMGNLAEARRLMHRAIEIGEKAYEPDHPVLIKLYSNLAGVENDLGNPAEVLGLLQKSMKVARRFLAANPSSFSAAFALGSALKSISFIRLKRKEGEDVALALEACRECVMIFKKLHEDSPFDEKIADNYIQALNSMAAALELNGYIGDAAKLTIHNKMLLYSLGKQGMKFAVEYLKHDRDRGRKILLLATGALLFLGGLVWGGIILARAYF